MTQEQETVKQNLSKYKYVNIEITRLVEEIESTQSLAEKITSTLSLAPTHTNNNDKIPKAVERLQELKEQLHIEINNKLIVREDIIKAINSLEDESEKTVLNMRFIDCLNNDEIATRLHFSRQHTHRIYLSALDNIRKTKHVTYYSIMLQ